MFHIEDSGLAGSPLGHHHHAIRNLVSAVIESAVFEFREVRRKAVDSCARSYHRDFAERRGADAALRSYAGRWITGVGRQPFAFEWCCIALDLEPERVRQGILARNSHGRSNSTKVWNSGHA